MNADPMDAYADPSGDAGSRRSEGETSGRRQPIYLAVQVRAAAEYRTVTSTDFTG